MTPAPASPKAPKAKAKQQPNTGPHPATASAVSSVQASRRMVLEKIRIENFRSFTDETIELDRYTCLVGPNGCGKSTILTALNVFFRNTASAATNMVSLGKQDFHQCNTASPIKITLTFGNLPEEAKSDLKHYVRHDSLVVSARADWNETTQCADVMQYGSRLVMNEFVPFFEAKEKKEPASTLTAIYSELSARFSLPSAGSSEARGDALRAYEESHPEQCILRESPSQFFGFTKGSNLLTKYIQWVYIPAVKDASSEQDESGKTALGQLLERTTRQKVDFKKPIADLKRQLEQDYKKLVAAEKAALADLEHAIQERLRDWSNPGANLKLDWHYDPAKSLIVGEPVARASIGEGAFLGEVARLGHGLQRSFLISVLHELAAMGGADGPTLLLGFEEPELYQHPPQAQHMATVLEDLASAKKNAQIIISTHSPYFVSAKGFESVRMLRKHNTTHASSVAWTTLKKVEDRIANALKEKPSLPTVTMTTLEQIMQPTQRELYFSRVAILVEGIEDVAFISAHLHVTGKWSEFRRLGCHFVVAAGKTNLSRPLAVACELKIPTFLIFDGDGDKSGDDLKKEIKDNSCLFRLCGVESFDPIPKAIVWGSNHAVWPSTISHAVRTGLSEAVWQKAENDVRKAKGYLNGVKQKNNMLIAGIIEHLGSQSITSPVLETLCSNILSYAGASHN